MVPGREDKQIEGSRQWETVCHTLDRESLLGMEGNPKSCGVWAPCLSYANGLFYFVYTGVFVGIQCVDLRDKTAYADFESFTYTPAEA